MTCFTTIETISQKKRKDSLETRVILLIFSPELEISGVVLQQIHQNGKKMVAIVRNGSVKMTLKLF